MARRSGTKLSNFCLNRFVSQFKIRSSPPVQSKTMSKSGKADQNTGVLDNGGKVSGDVLKPISVVGRKIMIVVDSSLEAKSALQWALSHTVQKQDVIVLLTVIKPSRQGEEPNVEITPRNHEFFHTMKNTCNAKRPEVQVEFAVAEGTDKGATIVEEAKKRGITLLVLGQKKRSVTWWLLMAWAGTKIGGGVVEYCIQNATCMAIAVRRKSKKLGGYLITTKRQKDFWLLA